MRRCEESALPIPTAATLQGATSQRSTAMTHNPLENNFAGIPSETAQQPHGKELPPEHIPESRGRSPPKSHSRVRVKSTQCNVALPRITIGCDGGRFILTPAVNIPLFWVHYDAHQLRGSLCCLVTCAAP